MTGITLSLCRIQSVYMLDPAAMAAGVLRSLETEARLSVDDLEFVAEDRARGEMPIRAAVGGKEYAMAVEWMEAAYG